MTYSWRSLVLFIIMSCFLVAIDGVLVDASNLLNYVGRAQGVAEPIDNYVADLTKPSLKLHALRKNLLEAETDKDRIDIMVKLAAHLSSMKREREAFELYSQMIEQYGQHRTKHIIDTYSKLYAKARQEESRERMRELLLGLGALAEKPTPDFKLMKKALDWAKKDKFDALYAESLERMLDWPHLSLDDQAWVLNNLLAISKSEKNEALLESIRQRQKEIEIKRNEERRRKQIAKNVDKIIKSGDLRAALDKIAALLADDEEPYTQWRSLCLSVAGKAIEKKDFEILREVWKHLGRYKPYPDDEMPVSKSLAMDLERAAFQSIQAFLREGREDGFRVCGNTLIQQFPNTSLKYYIKGELWARQENRGALAEAPKKTYTIRHHPATKVTVDGKLDESVYAHLAPLPGSFWRQTEMNGEVHEAPENLRPDIRLFTTDTHLYIGARLPEPGMAHLRWHKGQGDATKPLWDDAFDFFMDLDRNLGNYQICIVKAQGERYHLQLSPPSHSFPMLTFGQPREDAEDNTSMLTATVLPAQDSYTWEIAIPLSYYGGYEQLRGRLVNASARRVWQFMNPGNTAPDSKPGEVHTIGWSHMGYGHQPHLWDFMLFE